MTLGQTRTAIKNTLRAVMPDGWQDYDYEPLRPVTPCFVVGWPADVNPNAVLGEGEDYTIPVRVLIDYQADEEADNALEEVLPQFVVALHADKTLGGLIDDLACERINNFGFVELTTGQRQLTATIQVDVFA